MNQRTCSYPNCERPLFCRQMCAAHYAQDRAGQELRPIRVPINETTVCVIDDCTRKLALDKATGRGMCSLHYQRWRKHGDALRERPLIVGVRDCSIPGCDLKVQARGWCTKHYTRWARYGDPEFRLPGEVVDGKRVCPGCLVDLPVSELRRGKECGPCGALRMRRHREGNPRPRKFTVMAVCEGCGVEFRANAKQTLHCSSGCGKSTLAKRNWRHQNARRARIRTAFVESFDRTEVFDRDGWICGLCHLSVDESLQWPDPMSASLDHVTPISRGGKHSRTNAQCAHLTCNVRKGASMPE